MSKSVSDKPSALVRPFLKWAGNKFRIVERVRNDLPAGKRLIEPFVGSGAVFLNTEFERYLLTDSNRDLIDLFNIVKQQGPGFIDACREMFAPKYNEEKRYYRLREEFNRCGEPFRRAVLFVYLNRHGYNGLCRYNRSGGFNVPFGRYKRPYFPEQELLTFHRKAKRATFKHQDFSVAMAGSKRGDVIYCDPPYVPLSHSSNFTTYSAGGFAMPEQQRLADVAEQVAARGVPVLISNHDTSESRRIYTNASDIRQFQVQRYISCNGSKRLKVSELLALYR